MEMSWWLNRVHTTDQVNIIQMSCSAGDWWWWWGMIYGNRTKPNQQALATGEVKRQRPLHGCCCPNSPSCVNLYLGIKFTNNNFSCEMRSMAQFLGRIGLLSGLLFRLTGLELEVWWGLRSRLASRESPFSGFFWATKLNWLSWFGKSIIYVYHLSLKDGASLCYYSGLFLETMFWSMFRINSRLISRFNYYNIGFLGSHWSTIMW